MLSEGISQDFPNRPLSPKHRRLWRSSSLKTNKELVRSFADVAEWIHVPLQMAALRRYEGIKGTSHYDNKKATSEIFFILPFTK